MYVLLFRYLSEHLGTGVELVFGVFEEQVLLGPGAGLGDTVAVEGDEVIVVGEVGSQQGGEDVGLGGALSFAGDRERTGPLLDRGSERRHQLAVRKGVGQGYNAVPVAVAAFAAQFHGGGSVCLLSLVG